MFFCVGSANAVEPDEVLTDAALEARARSIDAKLRCVVCQSQSIADSDAPLARDLRLLVRERLLAGDSDEEVIDFVAARYGDYVLLKPRLQSNTFFLWVFPAAVFLVASVGAAIYLRYARKTAIAPQMKTAELSDDDEAALKKLIEERG